MVKLDFSTQTAEESPSQAILPLVIVTSDESWTLITFEFIQTNSASPMSALDCSTYTACDLSPVIFPPVNASSEESSATITFEPAQVISVPFVVKLDFSIQTAEEFPLPVTFPSVNVSSEESSAWIVPAFAQVISVSFAVRRDFSTQNAGNLSPMTMLSEIIVSAEFLTLTTLLLSDLNLDLLTASLDPLTQISTFPAFSSCSSATTELNSLTVDFSLMLSALSCASFPYKDRLSISTSAPPLTVMLP